MNSTALIRFKSLPPEEYRTAKNDLYAWRNEWRDAISLAFTAQLKTSEGKTQRVLVAVADARSLEALPQGTEATLIPELLPVRGLVADIKKTEGWTPWKAAEGTLQFSPVLPVYCSPQFYGADYDRILATGTEKGTRKFITIPCPTRRLTQWRAELIENPIVVFEMRYKGGWTGKPEEEAELQRLATFFQERDKA